jgi:8-hydroxy-5-deazaflavin:NADPH oxidoreductase
VNIAVFGSGMVGRAISARLAELGHDVVLGTRNVEDLMSRTERGMGGQLAPFSEWHAENPAIKVATYSDAAAHGELIFNATSGSAVLDVLGLAGESNLDGKVLADISNPLDFSAGFPPSLFVCNTESLAERIQSAFPNTRVVKTLNTTNASVMVTPGQLAGGDHTMFVSGNDAGAKARITELLREFGWKDVIDLGDITMARGQEMVMPLWLRLMGALETPAFNYKIVR